MAHCDRETDRQRERPVQVLPFLVTGRKHRQDQYQGDEKLHPKGLGPSQLRVHHGQPQGAPVAVAGGGQPVKNGGANDGTNTLAQQVEDGARQTDAPGDEEPDGHRGVDVAPAYVTNDPYGGRYTESETQSDLHQLSIIVPSYHGPASNHGQDEGPQKFRTHGAPKPKGANVI